ncbi:hypothetical protein [Chryseobacterium ginsenosidimutans]|uniref:hypothetical protein n=1 Tax=Chryseobacterium ginsenosidimutans TaxID=687846 RepID=UPI0031DB9521
MTKKLISWLSFMMVFLTLLWSCHNEDFANSGAEPQRNNANFFKHVTSVTAKSGVDYVSILEVYNREKDFLSIIPDQKGMPIWDKMQVVDTENATGLMIPLSDDNVTMSSVLFATLDNENTVIGVKDYDNNLLKKIVYDNKIDRDFREQMFYTFMYMDNKTFGNEYFTGVPKDLFKGTKRRNEEYGRMRVVDFTTTPVVTTQQNGKVLIIETCAVTWHCTHHGGGGPCDYCSECYGNVCSTTMISVADDPFPGAPGSSGGGGGLPPSGPEGNIPSNDPCALNGTTFYRLAPGCSGSGNPDIPDLDNPCKKTKPFIDKANDVLHSTVGQTMDTTLKGKIDAPKEWALAIGQKPDNTFEMTPILEQDPTQGNVPNSLLTNPYIGDGHSHAGFPGNPSGGDLYGMIENTLTSPGLKFRYVYGKSDFGTPEVYALVVTDPALASAFLTQFPRSENYDPPSRNIKEGSPLGKEFYKAREHYSQGRADNSAGENYVPNAVAMAYILEKYNAGISIAKVDTNGNLKKINASVQQITVPNSGAVKEGVKVSKCP